MFKRIAFAAAAAALFGSIFANFGEASETSVPTASYVAVGGATSVPYGWVDFCNRRPEECSLGKLDARDIRLTKKSWAAIEPHQ